MGEGTAKPQIQKMAEQGSGQGQACITLLPHGSADQARALMRTADFGLVTLTPGIINYAYPSKTMTYLSEGLPLLVAVESDSELATTVRDERIGFTARPDDPSAFEALVRDAVAARDELPAMRERAKIVGHARFGKSQALDKWRGLLELVGSCVEGAK